MASLVLRWVSTFGAVWVAGVYLPGRIIEYPDLTTAAIFAAVLALLNALVRPVLAFISIPLTCITLGLFHLVLAALMFWLAGQFVPDEQIVVHGALGAVGGAVLVGLVGAVVSFITR